MSIENGKLFDHCFWINWDQLTPKDGWKDIEDWCNESCSGQWMDIGGAMWGVEQTDGFIIINAYSRSAHSSPIPNENYPAAHIKKNAAKILMFEKQEDAVAFKLRWME